jgi:hypothetical protein
MSDTSSGVDQHKAPTSSPSEWQLWTACVLFVLVIHAGLWVVSKPKTAIADRTTPEGASRIQSDEPAYIARRAIPFVSQIENFHRAQVYSEARARIDAGRPGYGDEGIVTEYENQQRREAERSIVEAAFSALVYAPAIAGEAFVFYLLFVLVFGLPSSKTNHQSVADESGIARGFLSPTLEPDTAARTPNKGSAGEKCALAAFWCGLASVAYPFCITGPLCAIAAIVLGCMGLKSASRWWSIVGIVLAVLSLFAFSYMTGVEIQNRSHRP